MEIHYKSRPWNFKKLLYKAMVMLVCGAVFAFTVVAVFYMLRRPLRKAMGIDDDNRIVFQVAGTEAGEESGETATVREASTVENAEASSDYYEAGVKANRFLVGVNEVSTEGYGGKRSYSDYGYGIIIGKTKKTVVVLSTPNAVRGMNATQVTFFNGQTVRGNVSATDTETGISIIRVELKRLDKDTLRGLEVAKLGKSYALKRGNYAAAIGNPLGDVRSIVVGQFTSVGGKTRLTDREYSLLETNILGKRHTAGFLVDKSSTVIGVITHREDEDGENYTIKALGISDLSVLTDALCNGKERPFIGLQISTISTETARAYEIPKGVYVEYVYLRSPAVEAGIQKGDILVSIGKREIRSAKYFAETLDQLKPGTTVKVQFMRYTKGKYKRMSADVVIAKR
ncbi:Trypsin-like peptidase domain-containing protein [Lachnospiraceae bacterium XBB1006]|nr:Trypsin-like peptidase domain-containing protein [Lachnospiraceae bacterium XBB1006]